MLIEILRYEESILVGEQMRKDKNRCSEELGVWYHKRYHIENEIKR